MDFIKLDLEERMIINEALKDCIEKYKKMLVDPRYNVSGYIQAHKDWKYNIELLQKILAMELFRPVKS